MGTSKLALYNQSLLELKQRKLAALTDSNVSRRTLDDYYDTTVAYMLAEGMWNFAIASEAIEASTDVEPEFGFTYAIEKPENYVRLVAIAANGDFWPTLNRYHEEGSYWHCDVSPLYVRYVSNATTYGMDLSLWTPSFERAVALELAVRIAPHITGIGDDKMNMLERRAKRALHNARTKDAIDQAAVRPPPGRLVNSRLNGNRMGRVNRGLWDD